MGGKELVHCWWGLEQIGAATLENRAASQKGRRVRRAVDSVISTAKKSSL